MYCGPSHGPTQLRTRVRNEHRLHGSGSWIGQSARRSRAGTTQRSSGKAAVLVNLGQSARAPRAPRVNLLFSCLSGGTGARLRCFRRVLPKVRDGDHSERFRGNCRSGRLWPCRFFRYALPIPSIRRKTVGSPVLYPLIRRKQGPAGPSRQLPRLIVSL